MLSDQTLLEKIQARESAAFEELYMRYTPGLKTYLDQIVRDEAVAEDLLQEVFLRVWTRADQWQSLGTVKAWVYTIASNQAFNYLRTRRRRPQQPLEPGEVDFGAIADEQSDPPVPAWLVDTSSLGPEAALEHAEEWEVMRHRVRDLSEEKRQVLHLVHELEMSIRETAVELGVSEGTVKSRLFYARQHLRNETDQEKYSKSGE